LSDVLDVLGTVVAVAVAGEVVGAVVGAAVVAGVAVGAAVAARQQHRSFVAAERDVRTADAPCPPPVVPERKRKGPDGEDLPPASRARHPETWARNKKYTGLCLRIKRGDEMTAEIKHAAIPHPHCTSANCLLDCCRTCPSMWLRRPAYPRVAASTTSHPIYRPANGGYGQDGESFAQSADVSLIIPADTSASGFYISNPHNYSSATPPAAAGAASRSRTCPGPTAAPTTAATTPCSARSRGACVAS
jgi:hypothetical protein